MKDFTETHKRVFSTAAFLIEEKLLEIEICMQKKAIQQNPVHLFITDDLTGEEKMFIRKNIEKIKELLQDLQAAYPMKPEVQSVRREVIIKAAFLWETLSEYTGDRLRGYGFLDEDVKKDFQNRIEKIIELVLKIEKECE